MPYQPLYVAGDTKDIGQERASTPQRYELVATEVLSHYRRPFTILDIGASMGYFGLRAAHEYDATAVLVETGSSLPAVCQDNAAAGNDRIIALSRRLTIADLEALAGAEAFDVVLALNVLHWFGAEWAPALAAILELGDKVIIETPPATDTGALGQGVVPDIHRRLLETGGGRLIGETPSHTTAGVMRPIFEFHRPKRQLRRAYIGAPAHVAIRPHVISATLEERTIIFAGAGQGPRTWIPGINLRTYLELGGSWPTPPRLAAELMAAAEELEEPHGDLRPHNVILGGGGRVTFIDSRAEDGRAIYDDAATIKATVAEVRQYGMAPGSGAP